MPPVDGIPHAGVDQRRHGRAGRTHGVEPARGVHFRARKDLYLLARRIVLLSLRPRFEQVVAVRSSTESVGNMRGIAMRRRVPEFAHLKGLPQDAGHGASPSRGSMQQDLRNELVRAVIGKQQNQ